jgi:hypothetical protein
MTIDLDERRRSVEDRLLSMRHAQGVALLDGTEFDSSTLDSLAGELEAITAAEGEDARRKRQQTATAEQERLANLRVTLGVVEEHRLEAVDRAEKAARDLAEALKEVRARAADAKDLVRAMGVSSIVLDVHEQEFRMGQRVSAALKPVVGLRRRYGQIILPETRTEFDKPWRDGEKAIASADINRALKGSLA